MLDDSRITGDFTVDGFHDSTYRFALAIDAVDADRYLPPSADEAQQGEATAGDIELPIDALENLDLEGHVDRRPVSSLPASLRRRDHRSRARRSAMPR